MAALVQSSGEKARKDLAAEGRAVSTSNSILIIPDLQVCQLEERVPLLAAQEPPQDRLDRRVQAVCLFRPILPPIPVPMQISRSVLMRDA